MKKHIMSGHGKHYLHVGVDGQLIDTEYILANIHTYCGKEYAKIEDAIANNVFKSVSENDEDICKSCARLRRNARGWAEHYRNVVIGRAYRSSLPQ